MSHEFVDPAERYRLEERIAVGGMGEVWRATDTVLDRDVAVKVLKREYADNAEFRERFEAEARNAAALQHPGVAAVFDFGNVEGRRPFLVMELVDGQPLDRLLAADARMEPEAVRDLIAQAADAVDAAHSVGIVHRDLKPGNLLVTPDRQVKITDFGIARAAEAVPLTQTGQIIGTPQYLSPEQAKGEAATAASDVYALGVVLFECLAGRRPFHAETPVATALAQIRSPVPPLPDDVPADLAAITRRALAKDPQDRYADGGALATALRDPAAIGPVPPVVVPQDEPAGAAAETALLAAPPSGRPRRRRAAALLSAVPLLLLVALAAVLALRDGDEPEPDPVGDRSAAPFDLDPADYVGRPVDRVAVELRELGLEVRRDERDNPGGEAAGRVAGLAPVQDLVEGDTVTVRFWGAAPAPEPEPTDGAGDGNGGSGDGEPGKGKGRDDGGPGSGGGPDDTPGQGEPGKPGGKGKKGR